MLIDLIYKYWDKKYDLNCAECMLYAANQEYDLGLSKREFKIMAGFGGGMAIEGVCGVASGAVATIGVMFTKDRGHESVIVKELTKEFMQRFHETLKTYKCDELKERYKKNDDRRCIYILEEAGKILARIIERERKNIVKWN